MKTKKEQRRMLQRGEQNSETLWGQDKMEKSVCRLCRMAKTQLGKSKKRN